MDKLENTLSSFEIEEAPVFTLYEFNNIVKALVKNSKKIYNYSSVMIIKDLS